MHPRDEGAPADPDPVRPSLSFSNNGIETPEPEEYGGSFETLRHQAKKLVNSDAKRALSLAENCRSLIETVGVDRVGFLTLTFPTPIGPKEARSMLHSLTTNLFPELFGRWVRVTEPHKYGARRGTVHFHFLVEVSEDIRTGVDFEALERREYRSASVYLRGLWRTLRERLPAYGFGRSELLPLKSNAEGVARYVGKYLSKGRMVRALDRSDGFNNWKGVRLIGYSRNFPRRAGIRFSWADGPGKDFRELVGRVGAVLGAEDQADMRRLLGKRWAFRIFTARNLNPEGTPKEIAEVLRWLVLENENENQGEQ